MRRSLPHPSPPLRKRMRALFGFPDSDSAPSRGGDKSPTFQGEIHLIYKLKTVNDNLAPPLSKGRLGGVWIYATRIQPYNQNPKANSNPLTKCNLTARYLQVRTISGRSWYSQTKLVNLKASGRLSKINNVAIGNRLLITPTTVKI